MDYAPLALKILEIHSRSAIFAILQPRLRSYLRACHQGRSRGCAAIPATLLPVGVVQRINSKTPRLLKNLGGITLFPLCHLYMRKLCASDDIVFMKISSSHSQDFLIFKRHNHQRSRGDSTASQAKTLDYPLSRWI